MLGFRNESGAVQSTRNKRCVCLCGVGGCWVPEMRGELC